MRHIGRSGLLVFTTYNPSGWSYFHWVTTAHDTPASLLILVGLALTLALVHLVRQAHGSLGVASLLACFVLVYIGGWVLSDYRVLRLQPGDTWLVLFSLTIALGIATSWPQLRRRTRKDRTVEEWQAARRRLYSKN